MRVGADTVRAIAEEPVTLDEAEQVLRAIDVQLRSGVRGPTVTSPGPFRRYAAALKAHWARKGEV